jgi:transposase-like protein
MLSSNIIWAIKNNKAPADNHRNGYSHKQVKTNDGYFELETHRNRNDSFEPEIVKKNQSRFTYMDDKILHLMTTREIVAIFDEMYGTD